MVIFEATTVDVNQSLIYIRCVIKYGCTDKAHGGSMQALARRYIAQARDILLSSASPADTQARKETCKTMFQQVTETEALIIYELVLFSYIPCKCLFLICILHMYFALARSSVLPEY